MSLLLLFASIAGGLGTFAALLPHGWLAALIGAPFGGSLIAGAIATIYAVGVVVARHLSEAGGSTESETERAR
jgi:hypothetical protein